MARDFHGEMTLLIEKATADGGYSSPVLASEIVEDLRDRDPELLTGWLEAQAVQVIRHQINRYAHSRRAHAVTTHKRGRFAEAAAAHDAGDSSALTPFLDATWVVEGGTQRKLAVMSKADLVFVADDYRARATDNRVWEAFFRALSKKLRGGQTVRDVYSEAQIAAMFQGFTKAA